MLTLYKRTNHPSPKGVILLVVMIVTLILAVVATTLLGMGLFSLQQATFYQDYNQALYTAESGLNYAIAHGLSSGLTSSTTGTINNASFYVISSTISGDTIRLMSTSTVYRLTSRVRAVSIDVSTRDPWKHMIWQANSDQPAGKDPTKYPNGYNSTSNGPEFGEGKIGIISYSTPGWPYGGKKFEPYWERILNETIPNAVYIGRDTTIINWRHTSSGSVHQWTGPGNTLPTWFSSSVKGLSVTVTNPTTYNVYGAYTGLLYIQGTMNITNTKGLFVYGQVYVVNGNININKTLMTVFKITTQSPASSVVSPTDTEGVPYTKYLTIACLDPYAPTTIDPNLNTSSLNQNAGVIDVPSGNSGIKMGQIGSTGIPDYPGGAMYISNISKKNGNGVMIYGSVMELANDINGWPAGNKTDCGWKYDPSVSANSPILGVDVSFLTDKNVLPKTWRELPVSWSL